MSKSKLRKKILKIREIRNSKDVKIPFSDIFELLKKKKLLKKSIGGYFPVNFEVDDIKILQELKKRNFKISLPVIKKNFDMYPFTHTQ